MGNSRKYRLLIWLRKPAVYPYFLAAVITVIHSLHIVADPFGLVSATNRISAQLFSTALAPFYGTSTQRGQDNVVVILYDQAYFDFNGGWPIAPDDHRWLIKHIAKGNPAAIFLDVYFLETEERKDLLAEFYQDLEGVNCTDDYSVDECKAEKRAPVFLAGLLNDAVPTVTSPLDQKESMPPRVTLAEIHTEEHLYRLKECVGLTDAHCEGRTAAFDLYVKWCERQNDLHTHQLEKEREEKRKQEQEQEQENVNISVQKCRQITHNNMTKTMYLQWGYAPSEEMTNFLKKTNTTIDGGCQSPGAGIAPYIDSLALVFNAAMGKLGEQSIAPCPYHTYIGASYVQRFMDEQELIRELADKIVLIGVKDAPAADRIKSHVHGYLPGVFWHAAALDNLIERGNRFLRKAEEPIGYYFQSIAAFALFFATAYFIRENTRSRLIAEERSNANFVQQFEEELSSGTATLTEAHIDSIRDPQLSEHQLRIMTLMQLSSGFALIVLLSTLLCLIWLALDYAPENWIGVAALALFLWKGQARAVIRSGAIVADGFITLFIRALSTLRMKRYFTSHLRSLVCAIGRSIQPIFFFSIALAVIILIIVLGLLIFFSPIFYFSAEPRGPLEHLVFGAFYISLISASVFLWQLNMKKLRSKEHVPRALFSITWKHVIWRQASK